MPCDLVDFLRDHCCISPRAWVEADRLHGAYRARGGTLARADFLRGVTANTGAVRGGILVRGVGLVSDWRAEDGGTKPARRKVARHE